MRIGSFFMLLSFINVQLLAFVVGWVFVIANVNVSITGDSADVANSAYLFGAILFTAAAILVILKYYKGKLLFYLMELGLVFSSFAIFFSILPFQEIVFGAGGPMIAETCTEGAACISIPLLAGMVAVLCRALLKNYRNIFLMFATAIVGGLLGASLDILPAAVFALALAVYDVIAVFYTKHMVTLAKELGEREAGFSITFPSDYKNKVVLPKNIPKKMKKMYEMARAEAVELGTGDLAIPAMLIVSAVHMGPQPYIISFWHAMATMLGATFGMTMLFYFIEKKKGYWPALPPLVFFALAFLLIYHYLLSGFLGW
ncbi:MAG: presenilin family intramembrane aspartyl protease [Candidatus Micrarchaeota archaeon]